MSDLFEIPQTQEEARALKQEILEKINNYNNAVFNNEPLPYTDEEIDELQNQYDLLSEVVKLTKEEKKKLANLGNEDNPEATKVTVVDKISTANYLYGIILTIFISGILSKQVGEAIFNGFMGNYFSSVYKKTGDMYALMSSTANDNFMKAPVFWLITCFSFIIVPLILLIISLVIFLILRKKDSLNKKVAMYIFITHAVLTVIVIAVLLSTYVIKNYDDFYEYLGANYYIWVNNTLKGI